VIGVDDQNFSKWKTVKHLTKATYLRLLIPSLIDENKVIYLDSDLIVLSDLSELYATLTHQFLLAGVLDPFGAKVSKLPRAEDDIYINTGVLVMNLESLRQDGFIDKCAKIYSSHHELVNVAFNDQCLINKYAEKRKINIDPKWNRMVYASAVNRKYWDYSISDNTSSIIHFIGPLKPWNKWCNPIVADFWWEYANKLATKLGVSASRLTALPDQLCSCRSGKKFKHCHGAFFEERDQTRVED
jgi:lipopolysaccharide biosynthesis glycosyltransferase